VEGVAPGFSSSVGIVLAWSGAMGAAVGIAVLSGNLVCRNVWILVGNGGLNHNRISGV
jgi:hypothetical protein